MLEIILLIFLCKNIGEIAMRKGLNPTQWKIYTVVTWILFEFIGFFIGAQLLQSSNFIGLMLLALVSAFGGYLLVKFILEKKPDQFNEDDINNIGNNSYRP